MEIEAKYLLKPEEFRLWRSLMQGDSFRDFMPEGGVESWEMRSFYFDDAERSMLRSGACIRLRLEKGSSVLTVKASLSEREGRLRRQEWEWRFPEEGTDWLVHLPALPDFAWEKLAREGEKDPELSSRLALLKLEPVSLLTEIQFVRQLRFFRSGQGLIEWALDEGCFRHGKRTLPFLEMEAELKAGKEKDLQSFLDELKRLADLKPETRSKLERALQFAEQGYGQ